LIDKPISVVGIHVSIGSQSVVKRLDEIFRGKMASSAQKDKDYFPRTITQFYEAREDMLMIGTEPRHCQCDNRLDDENGPHCA